MKDTIRAIVNRFGYDIKRLKPEKPDKLGVSDLADMQTFLLPNRVPLILDIGANKGQTVKRFKEAFPTSTIHSFEPSSEAYGELKRNVADENNVFTWNYAVGSRADQQIFQVNAQSEMSSFLDLGKTGWGNVTKQETVEVITLDDFLNENQITTVDILKSDTQGYDLEVFKGAIRSMQENRIGLLYFEFTFSEMYQNLPPFDKVFRFLIDHNFLFVTMYSFRYQNHLAGWNDLLFINKEYYEKRFSQPME